MKIYHSAFSLKEETNIHDKKFLILKSFYNDKKTTFPNYCGGVFLDSGAFSAFNSKKEIDIQSYISFLKENKNFYDVYAGLDVIGNAKKTLENQKLLDSKKLKAIPTFHYGEDIKYLKNYLKKYKYIALGGMVSISGSQALYNWLTMCWNEIEQYPKVKVHGFGLTNFSLAKKYDWYSIDSTTAGRAGRVGVLVTPWGQLRVSTSIKSKTSATICTPMKIDKVVEWCNSYFPDVCWEDISSPTVEATQIRTYINALFIEEELKNKMKKETIIKSLF